MNPQVSVILCVRDDRGGLRATVASVLEQAGVSLELLVVDDHSRDHTPRLLAELAAADARVRVLTHDANRGLTASINHGLDEARGAWIARIDEGDTWAPGKLAAQWARIDAEPGLVLVGTQCTYRDPASGRAVLEPRMPTTDRAVRAAFVRGLNPLVSSSASFRRFPGLRYNEGPTLGPGVSDPISDYEYWLRLSFLGRVASVDRSLVDFSYGPGYEGITSQRAGAQFALKRRIHQGLIDLLQRGDRAAARRAVVGGFPLGTAAPGRGGPRRQASLRARYAASYRREPWRSLLRVAGYALDPEDFAFHMWSKLWLPRALGGVDWCGWVDPQAVGAGQPSSSEA